MVCVAGIIIISLDGCTIININSIIAVCRCVEMCGSVWWCAHVCRIVWSCAIMCEHASSCVHTPLECDVCNYICVQSVCCDVCIWAMAHDTLKIMCALRCMGCVGIVWVYTRIVCGTIFLIMYCVLYGVSWMWRYPQTFHTHTIIYNHENAYSTPCTKAPPVVNLNNVNFSVVK